MGKIKQLPLHEAYKIAAGEVVERPASVVKELVENALDAGSTAITVSLEDGGKELIRIVDNGSGMCLEDARLSIGKHTTSKITGLDDLITLTTFGFRGEALSSISAVSKMQLATQEQNALMGVRLTIGEGVIQKEEQCVLGNGTDIQVRELFYNVPARRKFLKSKETEMRAVTQLLQAIALMHVHVYIKLYHEDKLVLSYPPVATHKDRVIQIYGDALADVLIEVSHVDSTKSSTIEGLISHHQYGRYDKNCLFFFVNNRWVKNYKLGQALMRGYVQVLPKDKYPAAFIFITMPGQTLDVNIHPRKEEIQFLDPHILETALTHEVYKRLEEYTSIKRVSIATPPIQVLSEKLINKDEDILIPTKQPELIPALQSISAPLYKQQIPANAASLSVFVERAYRIIGQLQKTYILIEREGLILIDAHAAHERILYERFQKNFYESATVSLVFPHTVILTEQDIDLLMQFRDVLTQQGIYIERFGQTNILVSSVPVYMKDLSIDEILRQCIGWMHELQQVDQSLLFTTITERLRAMMACKAAVKAGDILNQTQIYQLLDELETTPHKLTCPHGRPTQWLITVAELEKKFKRRN